MHKVILVDDEYLLLEELKTVPNWSAYDLEVIATASSGAMALSQIIEHRPQLLITDIRMPIMDGLTLIEKARGILPDLICVILSGYSEFDYAFQAIKLGVSDYLLKPFSTDQLHELLERIQEKLEHTQAAKVEDDVLTRVETALSCVPDEERGNLSAVWHSAENQTCQFHCIFAG